ncbi:LysR family transcriptional regulator [Ferrimicrobium acidiphilum]|uniref:LysR family transcriptional regulator n=1 Tax=Ferrimicrobium acidiphilum TaxID=121039 RepID=UPI0023F300A8|nr:LysR family transcriptional regulator [Ferrimicrobium acidiphilum]
MDIDQLKYFQVLADAGNFTRASSELILSQSALSRSISRLENELGVPLFERKSHGVVLNRYGEIVLAHAQRAVGEINEARQQIHDLVNPVSGTISLAFIQTMGLSFVPELITEFQSQFPLVKFELSQDTTGKILAQIGAGEVDVGFCSPQGSSADIDYFVVTKDELFLIVPKSHRLSGCGSTTLASVADDPFVLFKAETALREVIEDLCRQAGFYPKVVFEGIDEKTVAGLVGANFGVALIPVAPDFDQEKVSVIKIVNPRCLRQIHLVWRNQSYMSPVARLFKKFVESKMKLPVD